MCLGCVLDVFGERWEGLAVGSRVVLGLAQFDVVKGRPELNFDKAKRFAEKASACGVDILLLPELWYSGYDLRNAGRYAVDRLSDQNTGRCAVGAAESDEAESMSLFAESSGLSAKTRCLLSELRALAASKGIFLYGSLITRKNDRFYNTAYLIDPSGRIAGEYDKIHLFGGMNEEKYFSAGERGVISDIRFGRVGLSVCYDLRFPELFRLYSTGGASLVLLCAEWPAARADHWDVLLKARAIENQLFVAAVNRVGSDDDTCFGGRSMVVDSWGRVVACGGGEEELVTTEIDLGMVDRVREEFPALKDAMGRRYSLTNVSNVSNVSNLSNVPNVSEEHVGGRGE